ncbi:Crp/Fnr family transcriptional regulator [Patescibacteria group bacterium]|nr:Crp/Fnr family transcriptional regulator [Patescibacteria group bacterium]
MLANLKQVAELVDVFSRYGVRKTYRKGDYIIRPGEQPPGVFYIIEGLVKAYDITKYGEENLLIIRKQDEIFPLIWALTGQERQVAYQALALTTVLQITRQSFEKEITKHQGAMAPLLDMTLEMYRLHSERILNLEYRTVRERIISFLLTMGARFGTRTNEGLLIEAPLRHQDIASSINATRETTSREISDLIKKGLIKKNKSCYTLKKVPELRRLLQ